MGRALFFIFVSLLLIIIAYFSGIGWKEKKRMRGKELKKAIRSLEKRVDNLDTIIKNRKYKETRQWQ